MRNDNRLNRTMCSTLELKSTQVDDPVSDLRKNLGLRQKFHLHVSDISRYCLCSGRNEEGVGYFAAE